MGREIGKDRNANLLMSITGSKTLSKSYQEIGVRYII